MSNLYNVCRRMIERGQTAGMQEKLDVFLAADRINMEEYKELTAMMQPPAAEVM